MGGANAAPGSADAPGPVQRPMPPHRNIPALADLAAGVRYQARLIPAAAAS
jgi:hypothetical protein